ncbi:Transposon TX1 uncharacterized 149 kDa protein [Vitis vinifera]|uniref:Transposon TX1 uncharacterized 149 kDa protein n=1 Tax=Vitis vinifera TaxID=29760 RepID=A0A438CPF9_VITVI|nr:Transposon TX1 uncharacterized 149 kDa protein [Vitis vinifera]
MHLPIYNSIFLSLSKLMIRIYWCVCWFSHQLPCFLEKVYYIFPLRLDSPFTEEEISNAIFQLDRDKAPGPDGFTIAVFQECWDVIKEELVRVFAEFHRSGIINQSTNASFIVLLPKKSLSKRISNFRPISLITSLYKIIAKVLSRRLRGFYMRPSTILKALLFKGDKYWTRSYSE